MTDPMDLSEPVALEPLDGVIIIPGDRDPGDRDPGDRALR